MAGTDSGSTELEPYRYREATWLKSAQQSDRRRASDNTGRNLTRPLASQELNLSAMKIRDEKLYKAQMWDEGIPVLQENVERCPTDARMRLRPAAMSVEI